MFPARTFNSALGHNNLLSDLDQLQLQDTLGLGDAQLELARWEYLNFDFDMEDNNRFDPRRPSEHSSSRRRTGSTQQPPENNEVLLCPFTELPLI